MKKNNSGYISAISLLIMAFLLLLTGAVVPRVGAELNFTSINSDGIEAQYAAESGAKYAAAQILNNPGNTDWGWARGNQERTFADGETFKITIYPVDSSGKVGSSPIDDGVALTSGSKYQIKSMGKVNGYSKTVKVIAYINTGSASAKAIYAANNLNVNNTVTINKGDVLAGNLIMNNDIKLTDGNLLYINSVTADNWIKNNHKDNLKPYNGTYIYTPDESTITSLPAFSAANNISGYTVNYTSGVSFPSPNSTTEWRRYYTLSPNTKYYVQNTFMQSDNKPITINMEGSGDTYITVKGNYATSNSGKNYINLNGAGNLVFNVIGDFLADELVINANSGNSVTINVVGNFKTTGTGITINRPQNGNVNFNVGGSLNAGQIIKVNGVNSGDIIFIVDGNLSITGPGIEIKRPSSGLVNFLINGKLTDTNGGLKILGEGSSTINIFCGQGIGSSGAGIKIDSSIGNVNIYSNSNFSASNSGVNLNGASVKVVANGDFTASGNNTIKGNGLLYVIGEGHDVSLGGSFRVDGAIIADGGDVTIGANTIINTNLDGSGGSVGFGSGTGTIEFSNWSSEK